MLHRSVRPAVSALCAVLVLAVAAGLAAAAYAAVSDGRAGRITGAALLGAPNGVWLGIPLGLLVPWRGTASGVLSQVLPAPLDELLSAKADEPVTLGRLAELDSRVWLLAVACALMILAAGVLAAVRTPRDGLGPVAFAARVAVGLGTATALALPLLVALTRVKADAGLSVLGFDAFGAGLELRGNAPVALALGAAWGAAAGAAGGCWRAGPGWRGGARGRTRRSAPSPRPPGSGATAGAVHALAGVPPGARRHQPVQAAPVRRPLRRADPAGPAAAPARPPAAAGLRGRAARRGPAAAPAARHPRRPPLTPRGGAFTSW
ncbi:streptophobe family protein [Streptomyces stramineus]